VGGAVVGGGVEGGGEEVAEGEEREGGGGNWGGDGGGGRGEVPWAKRQTVSTIPLAAKKPGVRANSLKRPQSTMGRTRSWGGEGLRKEAGAGLLKKSGKGT